MYKLESIDSIEELAATLAHEVKNPLSLVQANIALLESADKEQRFKGNYAVIKNELDKINAMVMDFLQIAKNDAFEFDIVYVYDIARSVMDSYHVTLDQIDFSIVCDNDEVAVLGSEQSLSQVLFNLVKNAVEALPTGKGEITIRIRAKDETVFISVTDNGQGIDDENLDNIDKTFFTTKKNGNGLGIPICKKVIKNHNGNLTFENNDMGGCTATIAIPIFCES